MDRLVDEAEGLAVDGSSPVGSSGAGGRMEVSAEQQLGLLNTITASDLTGEWVDSEGNLEQGLPVYLCSLCCDVGLMRLNFGQYICIR